jgi:hypothetical protein
MRCMVLVVLVLLVLVLLDMSVLVLLDMSVLVLWYVVIVLLVVEGCCWCLCLGSCVFGWW